jgi:hypothetical protein
MCTRCSIYMRTGTDAECVLQFEKNVAKKSVRHNTLPIENLCLRKNMEKAVTF